MLGSRYEALHDAATDTLQQSRTGTIDRDGALRHSLQQYRRALQLHLLLKGRENRDYKLDASVERIKLKLFGASSGKTKSQQTLDKNYGDNCCEFCSESASAAFMNLVESSKGFWYCSNGCELADKER